MKPKDLINPYTESGKRVVLDADERILFVPARVERPKIDLCFEKIFDQEAPIHLEFCSGNGEWIVDQALRFPQINWVALEMRFDRIRKIWSKMKNHGVKNLFILCGEALDISKHYLSDDSIDRVSINFPDPWPKLRHAKHRLIQPPFAKELARILKPGGKLRTLTDDPVYFEQIRDVILSDGHFDSIFPAPYFVSDVETYGASFFMRLWQEKKRSFYFSKFEKRAYTNRND